jgi:hypothetical protein
MFVVSYVSAANARVMSSVKMRYGFRRKWFQAIMLVVQQYICMVPYNTCRSGLHSLLVEETGLSTFLSVRTYLHVLSVIEVLIKSRKENKS